MTDKIYLGKLREYGEAVSLEKHKWDCDWYWAFGYIGNRTLHTHISALINHPEKYCSEWTDVSHQFESTWLTQEQWWILRDLFIQAYALKEAAECYRYGGHQTDAARPHSIICVESAKSINVDLEALLENIWTLLTEWRADK